MGDMDLVSSGFGLLESPRWHAGRLWFADWTAGTINVLNDDGHAETVVVHTSLPLCFDFLPDGTMLVVSASTRSLLRLTSAGQLVSHADLTPLSAKGANDIVIDGRGNAYVNSHDADMGTSAAEGAKATGRIYLVPGSGEPRLVADDLDFPNGMAVSPDNATLIVAESYRRRLTAFDIESDGGLAGRRTFAAIDGPPDGICIDADDAVWLADVPNQRCLRVADGGHVLDERRADRGVFACMLGGASGTTLYAVGARWPGPAALATFTDWDGSIWASPAPASRAGWPSN
jgi:sugar lactone lactonase YvrE